MNRQAFNLCHVQHRAGSICFFTPADDIGFRLLLRCDNLIQADSFHYYIHAPSIKRHGSRRPPPEGPSCSGFAGKMRIRAGKPSLFDTISAPPFQPVCSFRMVISALLLSLDRSKATALHNTACITSQPPYPLKQCGRLVAVLKPSYLKGS